MNPEFWVSDTSVSLDSTLKFNYLYSSYGGLTPAGN